MKPVIVVKNLEKWYGKKHVLKGLNLEVNRGEVFGLLGPNGAGKTTLIKVLTGQTPARGEVEVAGINPIEDPIGVRRVVGIVPESESVPNYLTVEEYLYFVSKLRNLPDGRVEESIARFDLEKYRRTICKDLSKGTKQRLMFAAALMHDPEILFLDEPFINLDPVYQRVMREVLRNYVDAGGTIFMATHILEMASRLCTRVGIIKDGKIVRVVDRLDDLENLFLQEVGYAKVLPD